MKDVVVKDEKEEETPETTTKVTKLMKEITQLKNSNTALLEQVGRLEKAKKDLEMQNGELKGMEFKLKGLSINYML